MNRAKLVFFLATLWAFTCTMHGHHATPSKVNRKNPVTLTGTVKEFTLQGPHALLSVDVKGEGDKVVTWILL